jgi:ABC-2 type transport system permease protein
LRAPLIARLRRWTLPYVAVFQADLAGLARGWVLRAWFVLTILVTIFCMLDRNEPGESVQSPSGTVLAALFHSLDTTSGSAHTLRELLKFYIVIWTSFIIVLTAGTIASELGVIADAVLSRGISRWQYYMGKWTARLAAVLGVYALVMVPATLLLWLSATPPGAPDEIARTEFRPSELGDEPGALDVTRPITFGGAAFALGQVGAILAFVVTCGVALSALFDSTVISIAVGWVSIYGTGLILSILDLTRLSPGRLLRNLPDILGGHYVEAEQYTLIGSWLALTLFISLAAGTVFARRDV